MIIRGTTKPPLFWHRSIGGRVRTVEGGVYQIESVDPDNRTVRLVCLVSEGLGFPVAPLAREVKASSFRIDDEVVP